MNVDRNQVYQQFREKEGKEYNDAIVKNANDLKERRKEVRSLTDMANKLKSDIEKLKTQLLNKQEGKN